MSRFLLKTTTVSNVRGKRKATASPGEAKRQTARARCAGCARLRAEKAALIERCQILRQALDRELEQTIGWIVEDAERRLREEAAGGGPLSVPEAERREPVRLPFSRRGVLSRGTELAPEVSVEVVIKQR